MKTTYKGITITENKQGMFLTLDKEYGSMAAAKGAITRWVNANVEAVATQDEAAAIVSHSGVAVSADAVKQMQDALGEDVESAKVYAECVYYGLIKHGKAMVNSQKYLSRNKREGKYAGRFKAYNKRFKMAHWRTGPKGEFDSLKESAQFKNSVE